MASSAKRGFGRVLQIGDGGGPEAWVTVAEGSSVDGPGMSADNIDLTHHESPSGHREDTVGLIKPGTVTYTGSYVPTNTQHAQVLTDFKAGTLRNWKIVEPSALGTWAFAGYITAITMDLPVKGKVAWSFTVTVSGKPTFT